MFCASNGDYDADRHKTVFCGKDKYAKKQKENRLGHQPSFATLDEALLRMTSAVGMALVQWQFVEQKLYQLYFFLCGTAEKEVLDAIFHELSLEIKIKVITELVRVRDSSALKTWDETRNVVFKHKKLRDKLAHWTVVSGPATGGGYVSYLCPPTTDPRAQSVLKHPHDAIGYDLLSKRMIEFQHAAAAVHNFMMGFRDF